MPDPQTLTELFFNAIEHFHDRPVVMRRKAVSTWSPLSYQELLEQVHAFSLGLRELGIAPGSAVAILSENRPEWAVADYACLAARCLDVPIYPTLPPNQVEYILRDSGAVAICVSSRAQLDKLQEIRGRLPALRQVIVFEAPGSPGDTRTFDSMLELGRGAREKYPDWREEACRAAPDDLATIIYTSGTTGDPKGVMLTHGNITSNVVSLLTAQPLLDSDECLSFLPLSHIFERMVGHYTMLHAGIVINYATSIDNVAAEMTEVRPTIVVSVPRLYEKIYARVLEGALSGSAIKKQIFFWARKTAFEWADRTLANETLPAGLALKKRIADKLVFSKLQARTGGRLRLFVSGGAPLSPEIARFFYAAGLPILEGYGLTETSPVIACNTFAHFRLGTVGQPIPGVEVQIGPDGEILARGPNVMQGYYHKPEATAEALDPDGWFHTGDIGELDPDGYLKITDRKKDLIVTAGGKNIAPQPIENRIKSNKYVANAVMLGDRRKFPIMLVVPNMENLRAWALRHHMQFVDDASLLRNEKAVQKVEREMMKHLRDLAQFEIPKKVLLIASDFSIESGELTPTLKVKRRVVEKNYRDQIEALYAEPEGGKHDLVETA